MKNVFIKRKKRNSLCLVR